LIYDKTSDKAVLMRNDKHLYCPFNKNNQTHCSTECALFDVSEQHVSEDGRFNTISVRRRCIATGSNAIVFIDNEIPKELTEKEQTKTDNSDRDSAGSTKNQRHRIYDHTFIL
jgi:hypothetical protein